MLPGSTRSRLASISLRPSVYDRGLKDGGEDARFILKHRRRDVYGNADTPPQAKSNFILNITLQEHYKRLERLGLPIPMIEGDYETDDEQSAIKDAPAADANCT